MTRACSRLLLPCLAVSLLACDAKPEPAKADADKAPAKTDAGKAPAKADVKAPDVKAPDVKAPAPAPITAAPVDAKAPDAAPAGAPDSDVVLDETRDFYGLTVAEIDGWKPAWEPDTVGIEWTKAGQVDVSMVLHAKPIAKVEDIESGFMAGTTLSKQDPPTTTPKGWYTIVTTEDGKTRGFVYVRQVGKSWLVCDTMVSRSEGDDRPVVPTAKLVEICDSADLPARP